MKQVISEKDYEQYKIYVPVKFFMSGKRRKYISSQLEKLHPCFSDNFCFDSKYGLSRRGLFAKVIVMDKLKLWDYKANYPGHSLTCGEKGSGTVFASTKTKALLTMLFCVPLICVLLGTAFWKSQPQKNSSLISDNAGEMLDEAEQKSENEVFAYEKFFSLIENKSGKIDSMEWKYDGFTEQFSVSLVNCYPDIFSEPSPQKVSLSNISYVNDVPSFSMNIINKRKADFKNQMASEKAADGEDYRAGIRNLLQEKSVKIVSESYLPYKIRFQISKKDIDENVLSLISEKAFQCGLCVNEVSLSLSSPYSVEADVSFSDAFSYPAENPILPCLEKCWENFSVKSLEKDSVKNNLKKSPDLSNAKVASIKNQAANNSGIKVLSLSGKLSREFGDHAIGSITHSNGEKVVFYKSKEGVITNE